MATMFGLALRNGSISLCWMRILTLRNISVSTETKRTWGSIIIHHLWVGCKGEGPSLPEWSIGSLFDLHMHSSSIIITLHHAHIDDWCCIRWKSCQTILFSNMGWILVQIVISTPQYKIWIGRIVPTLVVVLIGEYDYIVRAIDSESNFKNVWRPCR